jgi:hypothetical protein
MSMDFDPFDEPAAPAPPPVVPDDDFEPDFDEPAVHEKVYTPPAPAADPKEAQENALVDRRQSLIAQAQSHQVVDATTYKSAVDSARVLQGWIKEAEAHFDPDIAAANQLHKSLCAKRKAFIAPLEAALKALKDGMNVWYQAEQRRLEQERREQERQRADAARLERARIKQEAEELAAKGDYKGALAKEAEAFSATHSMPAATPLSSGVPKVEGATHAAKWAYRLTDKTKFIAAVARPNVLRDVAQELLDKGAPEPLIDYLIELAKNAVEIPVVALEENGAWLRTKARADGASLGAAWPGVEFFDEGNVRVSA